MKVIYLDSGWQEETSFAAKIEDVIRQQENSGYKYYDIKVSSNGNNALVIFEEVLKCQKKVMSQ